MAMRARWSQIVGISLFLGLTAVGAAAPQQAAPSTTDRAEAYYHFSLGHLYRQLAMQFVRQEYVERAIEEYKLAAAADPQAEYVREELVKLYASVNRLDDAVAEANKAIEQQPDNPELRKLLARIYTTYARDRENASAEAMLNSAIESYEKALELDPNDFEALTEISGLYRAAGRDGDALKSLEKALSINPNSPEALGRIASLYRETGDSQKSIEALEKALSNADASPTLLQELAQSYQQAGRHKEAAEALQTLLDLVTERGGNSLPIRRQLAESLTLSGEYEKAREQYETLLQAEPNNAEYHLRLSQIARERRRYDDAWKSLKRAQELEPDSLEIKYNTVLLLQTERRFDEAIQALEAILTDTEQPSYEGRDRATRTMFLEQLGALYREKEDYDGAIATYQRIGELNPETAPHVQLLTVDALRAAREFDAADQASAAAIQRFPDNRALTIQRAMVLAETGRADEGASLLQTLLNGGDGDLEIQLQLGQVYEKGNEFDKAVAAVAKAQKLAEGERQELTVLFTYGSVLERAKRFDEAEAKFRELLAKDPDNSSALNYLGYMLADRNTDLTEAHDMVQKALDLEPDNGAYLDSLGWIYYRQDKLELAERYLLRSLEQFGRDPVVHTHLGDVYFAMDRKDDARKHWVRGLEEWNKSPVSDQDPAEIEKLKEKLAKLGVKVSRADDEKNEKKKP